MTENERDAAIEEMVKFADAIVVDTCTLLEPKAGFWDRFWPHGSQILQKHKKQIIVPMAVYEELKAIRDNPGKDTALRARAGDARAQIKRLYRLEADSPLTVIKPHLENVTHADREILALFERYFAESRFVVLTQDRKLATDLIGRAQTMSFRHEPAKIQTLRDGMPCFARPLTADAATLAPDITPTFKLGDVVPSTLSREDSPLPSPMPGLRLTADKGLSLTLEQQIGKGGEGTIWTTDTPHVAKLYHTMSPLREAKLRKMLASPPPSLVATAYPLALLTDADNRVVGILMDQARGKPLKDYLFFNASTDRSTLLPDTFTRLHLVRVARAIVQRIRALHACGIVWGDINLANILLAFPEGLSGEPQPEIWLVDIDCAQIEGFPCLVGVEAFNIPFRNEHPPKPPYDSPLKTLDDDRFALAVLLFKLLMFEDLNPYQNRECAPQKAALEGHFPYPPPGFRDKAQKLPLPQGHYWHTWLRIHPEIKTLFHNAFTFTQQDASGVHPPTAAEWERALNAYESDLSTGRHDLALHAAKASQLRRCEVCRDLFTAHRVLNAYDTSRFIFPTRCPRCTPRAHAPRKPKATRTCGA